MKFVSVILIIAYLWLPLLCFGHPCDELSANAQDSGVVATSSDQCPASDSDNCEVACCCAGHLPVSAMSPPTLDLVGKQSRYQPYLALPCILDRIFVPPENHPIVTLHNC